MKVVQFNKEEKAEAVLLYNKFLKVQKVADVFAARKRFKGKGNVWHEVRAALMAGSSAYQKKQKQKLAGVSRKKPVSGAKKRMLTVAEPADRVTAMKECYRLIERRYNTIAQSDRKAFVLGLNGMALTLLGMSDAVTVRPHVVPMDFHARRDSDWTAQAAQA